MTTKTYRYRKIRRETLDSDVSLSSDEEGEESFYVIESERQHGFKTIKDEQLSPFTVCMFLLVFFFTPGFYTLPRLLAITGWYGLLLIIFITFALCYTAILLSLTQDKVLREEPCSVIRKDIYPYIVEVTLGKAASVPFVVIFNILLVCQAVGVVVYLTDSFQKLIPPLTETTLVSQDNQMRLWAVVVIMLVLPLSIVDSPKNYWFLGNIGGVLCILSTSIVMAVLTSFLLNDQKSSIQKKITLSDFEVALETCSAASLLEFCYGIHPFFPTLQLDCAKPRNMPGAILATFVLAFLCCILVSSLAYTVFGSDMSTNLLTDLIVHGQTYPSFVPRLLVNVNLGFMIAQGVILYAITITPLNNIAESFLGSTALDQSLVIKIMMRVGITAIVLAFALLLPHFVPILLITSALLMPVFTVFFPIVCYTLYNKMRQSYFRHSLHVVLIAVTMIGSILASYNAARNIYWIMIGRKTWF